MKHCLPSALNPAESGPAMLAVLVYSSGDHTVFFEVREMKTILIQLFLVLEDSLEGEYIVDIVCGSQQLSIVNLAHCYVTAVFTFFCVIQRKSLRSD